MTKREKQMQSMLNYYGINTGGNRDEKMTKTEKKSFLDRLNGNIIYTYLSIPKSEETKKKISKSVKKYFNTPDQEVNKSRKDIIIKALTKVNGRKVEQYSLQNILIKTYNSIVSNARFSLSDFDLFDFILAGSIHRGQIHNKISYAERQIFFILKTS
jgi:uncharacterized membrane protein YkoI